MDWIEFRSSRVLSLDQCNVGLDKSDAGLLKGLMLGWGKFDVSLGFYSKPRPTTKQKHCWPVCRSIR